MGWAEAGTCIAVFLVWTAKLVCQVHASTEIGNITTTWGFRAITGPEYENMSWHQYKEELLLKKIFLLEGEDRMYWECTRYCVRTTECASFTVVSKNRLCYLIKHDHCNDQNHPYKMVENSRTFDLRPATPQEPRTTCLSRCTGECDSCGRINCKGAKCDNCAQVCWDDIAINLNGKVSLWFDYPLTNPRQVACSNGWQEIWIFKPDSAQETPLNYAALWQDRPLIFKVHVNYGDNSKRRISYFHGVEIINESTISVGEYLQGDGNPWGAPFTNRSLKANPESNCLPFFYADPEECWASGLTGEATNDGHQKGYEWRIGDPEVDSERITRIYFSILPESLSDINKSDLNDLEGE